MKPLIVIPARGGSKGVPGKNIKPLNGKPLIHYTIEAARQVFSDELICVSTDSEEIKKVAEQTGLPVPFLRPDELATDTAGSQEVLLHALEFYQKRGYEADTIILLQVTSPFRNARHIREALDLYSSDNDMIVSVNETDANPYYTLREEDADGWLKKSKQGDFTRRQDVPKVYELNGAIYVINVMAFLKKPIGDFSRVRKYLMDDLHSIDIDTPLDWDISEFLIHKYKDRI